jgi:hypothetical protein
MVTVVDPSRAETSRAALGLEVADRKAVPEAVREMYVADHAAGSGDASSSTPIVELVSATGGLLLTTNQGTSLATLESFARRLS